MEFEIHLNQVTYDWFISASFGGFLGLFVGASLITLLEILELVVISVYRLIRNR